MTTIEYGAIKPTAANARAVQGLALDEALDERLPKPKSIANPYNIHLVARQRAQLRSDPDSFLGVYIHDKLYGYLQTGDWRMADELPFAVEAEIPVLSELQSSGVKLAPKMKLGIFGIAASIHFKEEVYYEIVEHLLDCAVDKALLAGRSAVNIALSERSLIQPVALEHGFQFSGRIHEQRRGAGVVQRLYSKPLDT